MKILLTGAKGQLGQELINQTRNFSMTLISTDIEELDITSSNQIKIYMQKYCPDLVINSSAYTNVEKAETEQDLAFQVNAKGPENLAKACKQAKIPLIHISTDYVFDGKKQSSYTEKDEVSPINVYGLTKEKGESLVREKLDNHIIIRTSWLYSKFCNNFIKTMLKLGITKKEINVVADQYGSPTNAYDLAESILKITDHIKINSAKNIKWGTYHYSGKGITTWYELAKKIFEIAESKTSLKINKITPIPTDQYKTLALRPPYSSLDCTKIENQFGIKLKPWEKSLQFTVETLISESA